MDKSWVVRGLHHAEKNEVARRMRREMTAAELAFWQAVRGNKLGGLHFRRQQVIDGFVADFYCHAINLVVEVDGEIHDTQIEEDHHREHTFGLRGLRVVRFTNNQVLNHLPACLSEIRNAARNADTSH
jgi:very-short-patch-repair endonuclease